MTYDREQLEKDLPPLHLPKAGESRSAFEPELDARLASLARLADLAPSECVGLALWLGSQKRQAWQAFAVDLSDCEENPDETPFRHNLLLSKVESEAGRELEPKELATEAEKARGLWALARMSAPSEPSMKVYVRERRAAEGKLSEEARSVRNPELVAMYDRDEGKLPVEHVKRMRREQLRRELQWSAARLQAS